jgi:PEGA domain
MKFNRVGASVKTCPVCKTFYKDDSLEKCANDGETLELSEENTPNRILSENASATADAVTSDLDVKQVRAEPKKQVQKSPPEQTIEPEPALQSTTSRILKNKWAIPTILSVLLLASAAYFYFWFYRSDLVDVNLLSVPTGAEVMLDGKKIGTTPLLVRIKKGTHQVVFEQIDYQPVNEILTVEKNGHVLIKKMIPIVNLSP